MSPKHTPPRRHEITDEQWARIEPLLPPQKRSRGRPAKDHPIDRELYLPKEWATDAERRAEAGVPQEMEFATEPQLAKKMLERALEAEVPCKWVTVDEIYGGDRHLRIWLEKQEQAFVLAVTSNEPLWCDIGRGLRHASE